MKKLNFTKILLLTLALLAFPVAKSLAHGVQVGYCQLSNGFIRIYVEHWHGDQTPESLVNNGMSITTTYGSTSVTQNLNPSGSINNTPYNQLSGCGSGINILSACSNLANTYNDWAYFDFAPAVCGQNITITLNSGNTVVLQEACSNLYPVSVTATFYDVSAPVLTCPDMTITSCDSIDVNYSLTAEDDCDDSPSLTYSIANGSAFSPGTTSVTATATDNTNKTSSCTFNVNIVPPALDITTSANSPCDGDTLNLEVTSFSGATYAWTGPNSFASSDQNPSINGVSLAAGGTYNVTITLSSSCVYNESVDVFIKPVPVVDAGNNTALCNGSVTLSPTISDATPDISGSQTVIVYDAYGGDGNFTNDLCNDGYDFISSSVSSPAFSITNAENITSIDFKAYWTCGDGDWTIQLNGVTVGTSGTLSNSYCQCNPPAGTYPGTFSITGAGLNTNWIVNGNNVITVIPNNPGSNAVAGFVATVNYDNSPKYSWSPATGLSSTTVVNPTANPTVTTTYTLTYTSAAGCEAKDEVTVSIYVPSCSIDVSPSDNTYTGGVATNLYLGYGPQSATMSATAIGGSGYTYSWSPATNLSNANIQNPVFTPTAGGTYTYTVTAINSDGCVTSCDVTFCVKDIQVSGSKGKKVYLCHVPPGNSSNPQNLSVSVNAISSHLSNHSDDALGACTQTCGSAKRNFEATDVEIYGDAIKVMVFPNPSINEFTFEIISELDEEMSISLMDMTGKVLSTVSNVVPHQIIKLGGDLSAGIYLARIKQGENVEIIKITKSK